jgi:hypothetical protein
MNRFIAPKQGGCSVVVRALAIIGALAIISICAWQIVAPGFNTGEPLQSPPTSPASSPLNLSIDDPDDTGLASNYVSALIGRIGPYGKVVSYEAQVNAVEHIIGYVDIESSDAAMRTDALELALHTFAEMGDAAGMISVQACTGSCCFSAGAGRASIQEIRWETVPKFSLFHQLDQGRYSDTNDYRDVAFYSEPPDTAACQ